MRLPDPPAAARRAGLWYVTPGEPGLSRVRRGRGLAYRTASGTRLGDPATLERIRRLVIPPAWTRVWICSRANGHIQAVGYDARGRKQYRYHGDWTAARNAHKFATLAGFGALLTGIRSRVDRDLRRPGMSRERVAACVVHLMDRTLIRVGNSEYARDNQSYGLTTMLNRHARVAGPTVRFCFKAKSGKPCTVTLDSTRAAAIVRRCQELPGQELFCYVDHGGRVRDMGSAEINRYLAEITGEPITAKDFRTWGGTCAAAARLAEMQLGERVPLTTGDLKRCEAEGVRAAAAALSNTAAVCRKFYVHPALIGCFADGRLHGAFLRARASRSRSLSLVERAVSLLLRAGSTRGARRRAA